MTKLCAGLYTLLALFLFGCITQPVWAQSSYSNNYQLTEPALGGSGLLESQSANFQAAAAAGLLGADTSIATDLQVQAGHITTPDPTLTFAVNDSQVSFGAFSPGAAAVATSTFEVVNYTSFGYVVQILGTEPTNGSHTIDPMSTTSASQVGVEQFGINLVANTSPQSLGANPDQDQFGFGEAAPNYATPNNYRFVNGETIALAPRSSGKTVYTISYIVNVTSLTPGGQYVGRQTLVCTGTY